MSEVRFTNQKRTKQSARLKYSTTKYSKKVTDGKKKKERRRRKRKHGISVLRCAVFVGQSCLRRTVSQSHCAGSFCRSVLRPILRFRNRFGRKFQMGGDVGSSFYFVIMSLCLEPVYAKLSGENSTVHVCNVHAGVPMFKFDFFKRREREARKIVRPPFFFVYLCMIVF